MGIDAKFMRACAVAAFAAGLAVSSSADNTIGRQSQNEGIDVLPAAKAPAIDGDLADWDLSGRICVFADIAVQEQYSVEAAAMWDKEYLYVAAKWKDPAPMYSTVNPDHNPGDGWKSDSMQLRIRTADQTSWVTTWYFTETKTPVLSVCKWKEMNNDRGGMDDILLKASPGGTDLGQGVMLAYKADSDGKGFAQEMRIPWGMLHRKVPEIAPGYAFRMGMEFLWGAPDGGKSYPCHRYADNMQAGVTTREFFWSAWGAWGDAKLLDKGGITPRRYTASVGRIEGSIPIRVAVPKDTSRFTIVIEDQTGRRVRNLAADVPPADYEAPGTPGTVEVMWDGLDDAGKLVAPGSYRVRGLSHAGISAVYEMSFYNPGTPPWAVKGGRGGWLADHTAPRCAAAFEDTVIISAPFAEGGFGMIGVGSDGLKRWSQYRGGSQMTVDEANIYTYQSYSWSAGAKDAFLCRYSAKDGMEKPFVDDTGKNLPFELSIKNILNEKELPTVNGMAAHDGKLILSLDAKRLAIIDTKTAKLIKIIEVNGVGPIAFDKAGTLHAVLGVTRQATTHQPNNASDHQDEAPASGTSVAAVNLDTAAATPWPTPGLAAGAALAFDRDGNLLVADVGPDSNVKAFDKSGKLVYACAKKGGRPLRGAFDKEAASHLSAVACDTAGNIWAVENWNYPRRVSVWNRDGKLVRDYVGTTGYSGVGCFLHDQKPGLAYCGPVEMKITPADRTWNVTSVVWVPDESKGERFPIGPGSNAAPCRFTSDASGKPCEYFWHRDENGPIVAFVERGGAWRPAAAVCLVGQLLQLMDYHYVPKAMPSGEFEGLDPADGCFWNDADGDGVVKRSECVIVPAKQKSQLGKRIAEPGIALACGWGGRPGADLSFYTVNATGEVIQFKPLRFGADGAPVYGPEGMSILGKFAAPGSDTIPVTKENRLVVVGANHGGPDKPFAGIDLATKQITWSYPNRFAGVHGSHLAPMPKPGLLIGPLKVCGLADMGKEIGTIFLIRGNLGQDYIFTTDGLYVGAMFRDCRLPGATLPDTEAELVGKPMEAITEGGEPFNGWFGRQADGKVRQVSGFFNQMAVVTEFKGLESIKRFDAGTIAVDAALLAKAEQERIARAAKAAAAVKGTIVRLDAPPALDGSGNGWSKAKAIEVGREGQPERASVRMGFDDKNLYAFFDVKDPSAWRNEGKDFTRLFKTGDCVDLHLRTNPEAKGDQPVQGDLRVVVADMGGKPAAVIMRPVDSAAPADLKKSYSSPVGTKQFDRVELLKDVKVTAKNLSDGYRVEMAIPLATLGLAPKAGLTIRGDAGIITSDANGMANAARVYWANKNTNLVNDLPLEAWLFPGSWATLTFE